EELLLAGAIRVLIIELLRAGRALNFDKEDLKRWEGKVALLPITSNDRHILALAIVSRARILFTRDEKLMDDFTNKVIISRPRGKCYSSAVKHTHLLR
ncbi:MAG: PIN domain-containing protein, partial [Acetobacteraceae bacterium]|nr:PIN domain-containing protein [Acetobacteraceae bacterium]